MNFCGLVDLAFLGFFSLSLGLAGAIAIVAAEELAPVVLVLLTAISPTLVVVLAISLVVVVKLVAAR